MGGHSIFYWSTSVVTNTGCFLAVKDKSFSLSTSGFELVPTCILVMSESSRLTNITATLVTNGFRLGPMYYCELAALPKKDFKCCWLCDALIFDSAQFQVLECLDQYPNFFCVVSYCRRSTDGS